MFNYLNLSSKLLLAFFLITCLSTFATTIFAIYFFSQKIKSEAIENIRRDMHVAHSIYKSKLKDTKELAAFLAEDTELQNFAFFKINAKLSGYLQEIVQREKVHQIVLLDRQGQLIESASDSNKTLNTHKLNYKDNPLLKRAYQQGQTVAATERLVLPNGMGLALSAASPIFKETVEKELVAVILVRYWLHDNPEFIQNLQDLLGVKVGFYAGQQLISTEVPSEHTEQQLANGMYSNFINSIVSSFINFSKQEETEIQREGFLEEKQVINNVNQAPIATLNVRISTKKYVKTTYKAIINLLGIMVLCILLALLLSYLLARNLLIPINLLLRGVGKLRSGELAYQIKLDTKDELGTLAEAFNNMAQKLNSSFQMTQRTIHTLTHVGNALSAEKDFDKLLELFVAEACRVSNCDGGTLYILKNEALAYCIIQNSSLDIYMGGTSSQPIQIPPIPLTADNIRCKISAHVATHKQTVCTPNIYECQEFDFSGTKEYDRQMHYKTDAMLVVPLLDRMNETVGVLQLINPLHPETQQPASFTYNQKQIIFALASQAAVAIENARHDAIIQRKNQAFERFVPTEFLQHLGKKQVEDVMLGEASQENMTVLFSDIRAFTSMSENLSPADSFQFLNEYLKFVGPNISSHGGFIDKYIGDAIMALFSGERVSSADDGVAAALGMLESLKSFNAYRSAMGNLPIKIGIGIHTGGLSLGTIGFEGHMETTVIGDTVNLASRIENLTKYYGISAGLTSTTLECLQHPENLSIRQVDTVQVKGKEHPVTIYELFNEDSEPIRNYKLATLEHYQEALHLYKARRWEDALKLFNGMHKQLSSDKVIKIYIKRCQTYQVKPPDAAWCGVTRLDVK